MQKRKAVFKIILILIISALFILITGGTVKANDTYWTADDSEDLIPGVWSNKEGSTFTGEDKGIEWTCEITEADPADDKVGKAVLTINNPKEISGEIHLPDKVQFYGGLIEAR